MLCGCGDTGSGEADRRGGINTAVANDVASVFKGKTVRPVNMCSHTHTLSPAQYGQLLALEQQIDERINSGDAVDIGYWESLLQQLKAHMARVSLHPVYSLLTYLHFYQARLRDRHQKLLRNKLFQLKQEVRMLQ